MPPFFLHLLLPLCPSASHGNHTHGVRDANCPLLIGSVIWSRCVMLTGEGWDWGDAWWLPIALSTREWSLLSQVRTWSSWHCDIPHKLWIQTGWLIVDLVYSMSLILHGHNLTLLVSLVPVMPKVPGPICACTRSHGTYLFCDRHCFLVT